MEDIDLPIKGKYLIINLLASTTMIKIQIVTLTTDNAKSHKNVLGELEFRGILEAYHRKFVCEINYHPSYKSDA